MDKYILKAEKRKIFGRKVKNLRKEGIIPAIIYGKKIKSEPIEIKLGEFQKVFKQVGETGLLELQVDGSKRPVLIHFVQKDPINDFPLHIDFLQVDLKEKVTAKVPITIIGESPVEKQGLGTVVQYLDEVEVEALPGDLPEKFEINANDLNSVDQTIIIKDLKYDKTKVEIRDDLQKIVVKVEAAKEEKEEITPKEEGEEKKEEVEAPETSESTKEGQEDKLS